MRKEAVILDQLHNYRKKVNNDNDKVTQIEMVISF